MRQGGGFRFRPWFHLLPCRRPTALPCIPGRSTKYDLIVIVWWKRRGIRILSATDPFLLCTFGDRSLSATVSVVLLHGGNLHLHMLQLPRAAPRHHARRLRWDTKLGLARREDSCVDGPVDSFVTLTISAPWCGWISRQS